MQNNVIRVLNPLLFSFKPLSNEWATHFVPEASGRKTSDSFITDDGDDGGIERKTEARSNSRCSNNNNKINRKFKKRDTNKGIVMKRKITKLKKKKTENNK